MMSTRMAPAAPMSTQLVLGQGGTVLVLGPARPTAMLGRDPASDIVIRDPRASRSHARIERRRDKFVLVDMSSNGTFVTFQGEAEIALKREEIILRSKGRIAFGHSTATATATDILNFSIEDVADQTLTSV
jgi:adenylate cyclase